MKRFIDNVSDKVIEYLCDNKTWDMHEVRNIISLHLSQGLEKSCVAKNGYLPISRLH